MNRILQIIAFISTIFMSNIGNAQFLMGGPDHPLTNPANCNTIAPAEQPNFSDNGGSGNYTPNFNSTMTFCPELSLGTKMRIIFATNNNYTFDIHPSDTLYIYDGPNENSPLLAALNNNTITVQGMFFAASWNNPTGCLTFKFVTDGADEGTGWDAMINCGNVAQPFEMHTEAFIKKPGEPLTANRLNPLDTGYVDVCLGDSILFVAKPIFPNSLEATGYGYSQDVNTNIQFNWNVSNGVTYPNNDSIWIVPTVRNGFLIELRVRDQFPVTQYQKSKIRVSQQPLFTGTGPLNPVICLGEQSFLLGGTTPVDTVGINIPTGSFTLGGFRAELTELPDGNGVNYTTTIPITGFPADAVITDLDDINTVCLTIEHSFLGDLEIWLQCPTGQIAPLINAYSPGFIPGGSSGGGTYLGHPLDNTNGTPGIGWEYCFSSTQNTTGPMHLPTYAANSIPVAASTNPPLSSGSSINPNFIYEPYSSFSALNGCPVNGNWTINVRDNIGSDDGYIFEWGINFDASFFPGLSGYQNTADSTWWSSSSSIVSGQQDTSIVIAPATLGTHNYTFNIIDNYGCAYDTVVTIIVRPMPAIFEDTVGCNLRFQVAGTETFNGGVWSANNPAVAFSNVNAANPLITTTIPGTYEITFLDNTCQFPQVANITFPFRPSVINDTTICSFELNIDTSKIKIFGEGTWNYFTGGVPVNFSPNNSQDATKFVFTESGNYILTLTDQICNNSDAVTVTVYDPPIVNGPQIACEMNTNQLVASSFAGGVWTATNSNGAILHDSTFINGKANNSPWPMVPSPGTYTFSYTDNQCNMTLTKVIEFPPYVYTQILDTMLCYGNEYPLTALAPNSPVNYVWNTGSTANQILVTQPGIYTVKVSNACHEYIDSAKIDFYLCDIETPNVISLNSKDGNDKWYVQSSGIADYNCVIVNRWGTVIYEYNDVNGFWDGRDKGGNEVSEGVYFFAIKAKVIGGQELIKQGFIQVVK